MIAPNLHRTQSWNLVQNSPLLVDVATKETQTIFRQLGQLVLKPTPARHQVSSVAETAESSVYDALANAKIMTSTVAMHLDKKWRDKLFWQLDCLHDLEEWETGDQPVQTESFRTFLRVMTTLRPTRSPGLSLGHSGHLIAAWTEGTDRLTLEFLPENSVRVAISYNNDGRIERAAIETSPARLPRVLSPYNPSHWLDISEHQSPK